jgi:hypothetical protein
MHKRIGIGIRAKEMWISKRIILVILSKSFSLVGLSNTKGERTLVPTQIIGGITREVIPIGGATREVILMRGTMSMTESNKTDNPLKLTVRLTLDTIFGMIPRR